MKEAIDFNNVTATLAIGTTCMAGFAAAAQSFVDFKPFVTDLAPSAVWQIFIAVPVLVLDYLLGFTTMQLAGMWFDHRRGNAVTTRVSHLIRLGRFGNNLVVSEYTRALRELELLRASCAAVTCLALGLGVKVIHCHPDIGGRLLHGRLVFGSLAVVMLAALPVLLLLVKRHYAFLECLIRQVEHVGEGAESRV